LTPDHGTGHTVLPTEHEQKETDVSSAVAALTEATFDEEISTSPLPVVVEFWAQWCPPCKLIAPILDSIAADNLERLRVGKVDTDEYPALGRRYDVMSVPTILVFAEGRMVRRMIGARSRARLLEEITEALAPVPTEPTEPPEPPEPTELLRS
jgi:thioredoxin 1